MWLVFEYMIRGEVARMVVDLYGFGRALRRASIAPAQQPLLRLLVIVSLLWRHAAGICGNIVQTGHVMRAVL